ncbi:MAG: toxin-antitoxin system HicB family antitoxin [Acidimicrobiales bacterium]
MRLEQHVSGVQAQLAAAAALGDEATRVTAEALVVAAEAAVRLSLLGAVTAAADEITAALLDCPGAPAVSVRLDGDDLRIEARLSEAAEPALDAAEAGPEDAESTARVSLRLPEALKAQVEAVARRSGVSVNTWIVRAASTSLAGSGRGGGRPPAREARTGRRLTGWING